MRWARLLNLSVSRSSNNLYRVWQSLRLFWISSSRICLNFTGSLINSSSDPRSRSFLCSSGAINCPGGQCSNGIGPNSASGPRASKRASSFVQTERLDQALVHAGLLPLGWLLLAQPSNPVAPFFFKRGVRSSLRLLQVQQSSNVTDRLARAVFSLITSGTRRTHNADCVLEFGVRASVP